MWKRLSELYDNPVIFDDDEPFDLRQGRLGDCWLIARISALGEYPVYLKEETALKGSLQTTRF